MKKLDKQLQKLDIYEYDDLESQRLYDEVKEKITQALRATGIDKGYLDPTTFTKRDLGIKATAEIYQASDGAIGSEEIQRAIDKVGKRANKFSQKESRAIEFIKACMSAEFYGYLRLRKWLGIPLESFTVRTWYAGYLPVIPLLVNPGGEIKLREGLYNITSTLQFTNSNIKFCGTGWSTIIKQANNSNLNEIIKIGTGDYNQTNNVTLENLQIDGNKTNNPTALYGLSVLSPRYLLLERVYIHDCQSHGIYINEMWNTILTKNRIEGNSGNGIEIYAMSDQSKLIANYILQNNVGLNMTSNLVYGLLITANSFYDNQKEGIVASQFVGNIIGCRFDTNSALSYGTYNAISDLSGNSSVIGCLFTSEVSPHAHNWDINIGSTIRARIIGNDCGGSQNGIQFNNYTLLEGNLITVDTGGGDVIKRDENFGNAAFSGDGITTSFAVQHGLQTTPSYRIAYPTVSGLPSVDYVDANPTDIIVYFTSAPPSGTNNVSFAWRAKLP